MLMLLVRPYLWIWSKFGHYHQWFRIQTYIRDLMDIWRVVCTTPQPQSLGKIPDRSTQFSRVKSVKCIVLWRWDRSQQWQHVDSNKGLQCLATRCPPCARLPIARDSMAAATDKTAKSETISIAWRWGMAKKCDSQIFVIRMHLHLQHEAWGIRHEHRIHLHIASAAFGMTILTSRPLDRCTNTNGNA